MEDTEYDLMAGVEDRMWWYRAVHANLVAAHRRHAGPGRGPILDAGCGTGGFLAHFAGADPGRPLVGLDFHPRACAYTRRKTGAAVVAGSINELPFADGSMDAIFSSDVLCHRAVDEARALAEFLRCLKPGGALVLNLPAYEWMKSVHDHRVHNARRYTRGGLKRTLRAAGFARIHCGYWNTVLFPLMVLRRKLLTSRDEASDVMEYPPLLNRLFLALTDLERAVMRTGASLPFGGSVLAVAVKAG
ncbi:MAG TPA: class I SAM-dependent methyltransferase [Azospirillaceae bacterium]|nr:class I SAM-dependent methyltransferase [Azospirillaceae bacterium]